MAEYILEPGKVKENTVIEIPEDIGVRIGDLCCVCFNKIIVTICTKESFTIDFYKDSMFMASLTAKEAYKIVFEKDYGYIEPIRGRGGYIKRHIKI